MILLKPNALSRVLLVRPGATDFDDQGRIKGSLDMPLSDHGKDQVRELARQIGEFRCRTIYTSPCESARDTAEQLAATHHSKVKVIDAFRNLDHGLWHGKLIEELRRNHPKLYRRGQESPADICPPGGESIAQAQNRVIKALRKVLRKNPNELVTIVIPDPMAWIVQNLLSGDELSDLWKAETDSASWELIEPAF